MIFRPPFDTPPCGDFHACRHDPPIPQHRQNSRIDNTRYENMVDIIVGIMIYDLNLLFFKNAHCSQPWALFELDFHTSCTGVLLRVTGLTKILLNWPVRGSCQVLKFGHQISGRNHGFCQNCTNLLLS